jgi:hypothetical protein
MVKVENGKATDQNDDRFGSSRIYMLKTGEQSEHTETKSHIQCSTNDQTTVHCSQGTTIGAGATLLTRRKPLLDQSPASNLINKSQNNDSG